MADAEAAAPSRPLDEVMLAMDVVDTLRHRQSLVARELARPESDDALLEHLRRIYASQGIDVSDRVLREGVEALREDRFSYEPPPDPPLWARLYVRRGLWARRTLLVLGAVLVAWGAYQLAVVAPREAIRADVENSRAAIAAISVDDAVPRQADALAARAEAALGAGDPAGARAELADLDRLRERLERSYRLVITTGPDAISGVWRVPDLNEAARNYYLIVEAVNARGEAVTLPILNEETGATERVSTFGLGVGEAVWDRVGEDLDDDGIIQDRLVAEKRAGELDPDYLVDTTGGTITRW